ncbi:MAG: leucyl/phenylalanyl-tRNA--protein transferase [Planctomycetota bacterium]
MRRRGPVWLGPEHEFPPAESAGPHGLLAVGGDLAPGRLLAAYRRGIFPWPWEDAEPMLWWCPDPRCVLYPDALRVTKSLEQRLRSGRFDVRLDTAFRETVEGCASTPRRGSGTETWITAEMKDAYARLHELGHAHSAEAWREGKLVGGLYGVALGRVFFGESMFHRETDASKVAFVRLVRQLATWGFRLVDCQLETPHLESLGAKAVPRRRFLAELGEALALPGPSGPWRFD